MLKNVEIVIIKISTGGKSTQNETTSAKSFGESVTSVLCAIYFGGVEFYDSVYNFHHFIYDWYVYFPGQGE